MTDRNTTVLKTNRIIVALDTSSRGRAALEAALQLALNTHAELQGLFVEDEDLVRLAALPFSSEVDLSSASPRELHLGNMEAALHAAAEDAQKAFANALRQANLQWTFRVVRGTVAQASLAAAGDVDLLVIGQQGRSPRMMAGEFLPERSGRDKRTVAFFDGSASAFRTLEFASRLAQPAAHVLSVLVLSNTGVELAEGCLSWLQERNIRAEVKQVHDPSENTIVDCVRKWPPAVLLINRDSEFVNDFQICRLVNEFDCPLVLC